LRKFKYIKEDILIRCLEKKEDIFVADNSMDSWIYRPTNTGLWDSKSLSDLK